MQGAEAALVALVMRFGPELLTKLPRLWERMSGPLLDSSAAAPDGSGAPPQAALDALVSPSHCNQC